jgi:hypothetical protein
MNDKTVSIEEFQEQLERVVKVRVVSSRGHDEWQDVPEIALSRIQGEVANSKKWLYIDGVQVGPDKTVGFKNSQNRIDNTLVASSNYSWGGDFTGNSANQVDFSICKIYNRPLSASEITQNYNSQKSRFNL